MSDHIPDASKMVEQERAAVVAWLRAHAVRRSDQLKADAIERGEHLAKTGQ